MTPAAIAIFAAIFALGLAALVVVTVVFTARDLAARGRALVELARTNATLEARLAERTIERDDAARDIALVELARTNAELARRLAERTIERDDVAREGARVELIRTNIAEEFLTRELAREHRASAAFQEAALPHRTPHVPGMRFSAIYRAAKTEALVGGDWYDVFRLDDGCVVLTIGDVMGSGLIAAVTMNAVRQSLRGAAQILAKPIDILNAADRALRSEQPESIVTAFVGILDPSSLMLTYASAGHPPPLLRFSNGEFYALDGHGLPLGLREMRATGDDLAFTKKLTGDSLLVLYTDGLIEATRDTFASEARVREAMDEPAIRDAPNPALAIIDHVLDEVVDDVAILTIRIDDARRGSTVLTHANRRR